MLSEVSVELKSGKLLTENIELVPPTQEKVCAGTLAALSTTKLLTLVKVLPFRLAHRIWEAPKLVVVCA